MKVCSYVCVARYTHSNWEPITKEDNGVPSWAKVPSWRACSKPMGAVTKKLRYKQKRDNRRSLTAGVYTLACECAIHNATPVNYCLSALLIKTQLFQAH